MKVINLMASVATAMALVLTGCSTDDAGKDNGGESGDAVLRISLVGEGGRATGTPTEESTVKKFTVYVFNQENQTLEAVQPVTDGSTSTTISGLSTGFTKRIVVVANAPAAFPVFEEGDPYEKLTTGAINLTYQTPANVASNGLVMMGEEENVALQGTGTNQVTITMKRLVAKVSLGTVTVNPTGNNDTDLFEVTGVSIQRAISSTDIYGNKLNSSTTFGGLDGSWHSTLQTFLLDEFSPVIKFKDGVEQDFNNYFYVLPNQDPDACTLLTLRSNYNGDEQFFPIRINYNNGNVNTDGTYITSNSQYIVNIVVNNLNEGTTDPDEPPTTASVEIDVEIAGWELPIIQDVIW